MRHRIDKTKMRRYSKMVRKLMFSFLITLIVFSLILALVGYIVVKLGGSVTRLPGIGIFILFGLCFLMASAAAYFIIWNFFKPLGDISKASKKIAEGDYSARLEYGGDIAELADAVENFNYMAQELGSVEMIRNDFIANVSHEFRTPLSTLSGYLTLLQDSSLSDEERDEYIRKAFFSIEKLNDLTDNILRLSKLENQASLDEPVTYRLDEQLRECIVMLEPKWSAKNIEFELDLPEQTYTGQRSLLFQVWTNIISNAIKFSENGSTVTIKLESTEHHYKVYISDEGIGMTEEQLRHIFDKFYQADSSRQSQGNGLGLALCKEILDKCGGKIFVTSRQNAGSIFLIQLKK